MKTSRLAHLLIAANLLAAFPARAATLSIGNAPGYPAQVSSIPVLARKATNVVAAQFDVHFSPARSAVGNSSLAATHPAHIIRSREIAPGILRTLIYSLTNASLDTNGFRGRIPFTLPSVERLGSGPLVPSNVILARGDGTAILPVIATSGTVFTQPVYPNLDGTMQFFLPSDPEKSYTLQATSNFIDWIPLTSQTAQSEFLDLVDPDAPLHPFRFYRLVITVP